MLNAPAYALVLSVDKKESPVKLWPCIPRIGESVEAEDGGLYKIVDIVHGFRRPTAQIMLVVEKPA